MSLCCCGSRCPRKDELCVLSCGYGEPESFRATIGEQNMKQARNIGSARFRQHSAVTRCAIILLLSLAGFGLSAQSVFAQTGYSGIFGGGPYYKNPSVSIPEIENSGFTEAIVWSVEVSSV